MKNKNVAEKLMELKARRREYLDRQAGERALASIDTGDYEEGLHICEGGNGTAQPVYLEFKDVDELKSLVSPDELVEAYGSENGNFHKNLKGWHKEASQEVLAGLDPKESVDICRAFTQYVYGNSRFARSYRDILNARYFGKPMRVPVLEYEDIHVAKGHPLYVGKPGEGATTLACRNIYLEEDAKIIVEGESIIDAAGLINRGVQSDLFSCGTPGRRGGNGGKGKSGSQGNNGTQGTDGKDRCSAAASNGGDGGSGDPGGAPSGGGDGTKGSVVTLDLTTITGTHNVFSYGGDGGNGGDGGCGGDGGRGGDAAKATSRCGKSNPGKGGDGGSGTQGGAGGNAGDGDVVTIRYNEELSADAQFYLLSPQKARELGYSGGYGGEGGKEGAAGKGAAGGRMIDDSGNYVESGDDKKGVDGGTGGGGAPGKNGNPGEITINGIILE